MSTQHQEVFQRCVALAKELEANKRLEDGVAVLRALSSYLEQTPATADRSCAGHTNALLAKMYARVRENVVRNARR